MYSGLNPFIDPLESKPKVAPGLALQEVEGGFPHSEILGSKLVRSSPRLIAAYHVLHRLSAPRHPPNALVTLDHSHDRWPPLTLARRRPIQRSPPGLGAPAAIGKTCLWNSHSKDVCLPNASSPHPLRGTCRPKIKDPGTGHMHYLFTMSNTRDRSCFQEPSRIAKISTEHSSLNPTGGDHHTTRHTLTTPHVQNSQEEWWSQTGSNRRPEACKATALPTELWPPLAKPRGF